MLKTNSKLNFKYFKFLYFFKCTCGLKVKMEEKIGNNVLKKIALFKVKQG